MFTKMIALPIIILFTIAIAQSCDTTEPQNDAIQPGSRDYTWEVDTLKMPSFSSLHRIWGSSENDVWAVGPGGDLDKTIYHYDGKRWSNDGISRGISPISIWGFSPNDVWLGGRGGKIWHYDGSKWSENFYNDDPVFRVSGFQDIWGEDNRNIWAVGYLDSVDTRIGLIYHYDGTRWERKNVEYKHGNILRIRRGKKTSNNYFVWGLWEDNYIGDSTKLFKYDGEQTLKQMAKESYGNGKWHFVQEIDDEVILTINDELYTYKNDEFEFIAKNTFPNNFQNIYGRNKKDIFWLMQNGITHYNGSNFQYILNLTSELYLTDCSIFKEEIFFLATDFNNGLNIIYHGRLKK